MCRLTAPPLPLSRSSFILPAFTFVIRTICPWRSRTSLTGDSRPTARWTRSPACLQEPSSPSIDGSVIYLSAKPIYSTRAHRVEANRTQLMYQRWRGLAAVETQRETAAGSHAALRCWQPRWRPLESADRPDVLLVIGSSSSVDR